MTSSLPRRGSPSFSRTDLVYPARRTSAPGSDPLEVWVRRSAHRPPNRVGRMPLEPGDKAPTFTLLDQQGSKVKLSDFKGRKVLVYFYPKADTPGCTQQACGLRDARAA